MIAVEQYNRLGLRWFFKAIGCIPVDRDKRPERAFRAALRALADGQVVALFPQGAIHHGHLPPRRLKGGVARLAALSGAPVYPVRVSGVRGEGHTLLAVVLRSRARLRSFAAVDCARLDAAECLEALSMLLQNDGDAAD
jgi:1-acyl-sn-glycerol-3-phosphate acyltransferase